MKNNECFFTLITNFHIFKNMNVIATDVVNKQNANKNN